jgi:hypothetical protein
MTGTTPRLRAAAALLLDCERVDAPDGRGSPATHVFEKLRRAMAKLLGTAGFSALLQRAVTLAQEEAPLELASVHAKQDGSLDGLLELKRRGEVTLVAHVLGLLVTFIGEGLTLQLLKDVWPTVKIASLDQGRAP